MPMLRRRKHTRTHGTQQPAAEPTNQNDRGVLSCWERPPTKPRRPARTPPRRRRRRRPTTDRATTKPENQPSNQDQDQLSNHLLQTTEKPMGAWKQNLGSVVVSALVAAVVSFWVVLLGQPGVLPDLSPVPYVGKLGKRFGGGPGRFSSAMTRDEVETMIIGGLTANKTTWLRRLLHHKRWHYVSVSTSRCFVGAAIAHLGYASSVFAYVVDKRTSALWRDYGDKRPLGAKLVVAGAGLEGCSQAAGFLTSTVRARVCGSHDGTRVSVQLKFDDVEADFRIAVPPEPLSLLFPLQRGRLAHTLKFAGAKTEGWIAVNDHNDTTPGLAVLDYTSQLAKRRTVWRWLSVSGRASVGFGRSDDAIEADVGINLSDDMYDVRNVSQENAVWINGRLRLVDAPVRIHPPVVVARGRASGSSSLADADWRVASLNCSSTCIDLRFTPLGARQDNVNLSPFLHVDYVQPFGRVRGFLRLDHDVRIQLHGLWGVVERHFALW